MASTVILRALVAYLLFAAFFSAAAAWAGRRAGRPGLAAAWAAGLLLSTVFTTWRYTGPAFNMPGHEYPTADLLRFGLLYGVFLAFAVTGATLAVARRVIRGGRSGWRDPATGIAGFASGALLFLVGVFALDVGRLLDLE